MNSPPTSLSSLLAQPSGHNALGGVLNGTQAGPETSSLRDQGSSRLGGGPNQVQTQADDDLSTGQAALLTYLRDHCPPGSTPYASGGADVNSRDDQSLGATLPRSTDSSAFPGATAFDPQLSDPAIFAGNDAHPSGNGAYEAYVDPALAALAQRDMISADRHAAMFPVGFGGHSLHDPEAVNAAIQAKADKGEMGGKRKRPILPLDQYSVSEQATLGSIPGSSIVEAASPEDEGSAAKKTKDNKDTKVKRAEQNRKAQQAFRKRREEHIKKLEYDAAALEEVTKARDDALERWQYLRLAWDTARIEISALQATLVNLSRNTALHITKPDGSLYLSSSTHDNERPPTERTTDTDLQVAFQILQTQAKAIAQRNQNLPETFHRSAGQHDSGADGSRSHDV